MNSKTNGNAERPNWVEIGTLVVAVLVAIGGIIQYLQFGHALAALDSQLKQEQVEFNIEQVLQIDGVLAADDFPSSRLATVSLHINNIRREPVVIDKIHLKVSAVEVGKELRERLRNDGGELGTVEPATPEPSRVSILNISDNGELLTDPIDSQSAISHSYDPTQHSVGKILAGQKRQVNFDLLVEEGNVPALYLVKAECSFSGEDAPYTWETWLGLGGFPNRPRPKGTSSKIGVSAVPY